MRKILSRNIDILTLFYCQKPITGYDLIGEVEKAFGVRLSPGVVYSSLLRLERDDLLSHHLVNGKHGTRQAYNNTVTEKGRVCFLESVHALHLLVLNVKE